MRLKIVFALSALTVATGCYLLSPICEPGETRTCVCIGGVSGVQTCNDEGSKWHECTCIQRRNDGGVNDIDSSGNPDSTSVDSNVNCSDTTACRQHSDCCVDWVCDPRVNLCETKASICSEISANFTSNRSACYSQYQNGDITYNEYLNCVENAETIRDSDNAYFSC